MELILLQTRSSGRRGFTPHHEKRLGCCQWIPAHRTQRLQVCLCCVQRAPKLYITGPRQQLLLSDPLLHTSDLAVRSHTLGTPFWSPSAVKFQKKGSHGKFQRCHPGSLLLGSTSCLINMKTAYVTQATDGQRTPCGIGTAASAACVSRRQVPQLWIAALLCRSTFKLAIMDFARSRNESMLTLSQWLW